MAVRKYVKLLVVDDQREQFEQIQDLADMYSSDYSVECKLASSDEEARGLLSTWRPSVILLDIHLTGSKGFDLLSYLSDKGAPVVATSEIRIADMTDTAEQYGAVGYRPTGDSQEEVELLMDYLAAVSVVSEGTH